MLENKIIKTEQTLLSELLSIDKALELINDLILIEATLKKMAKANNQQAREDFLINLIESHTVVNINAEYYDNNDYSGKNLVVNIGYECLKFINIHLAIAYDYSFWFSFDNLYFENKSAYIIDYEDKDLSCLGAEVVFSALAEKKRLELVAYCNSKTISGGK